MEKMKNVSFKLKLSLIDKIKVISNMLGPNENTSSLVRHLLQKGFDQIPIENEKSKDLEVILSRLENGHKIRLSQLMHVFCMIRPFIGMDDAYLPQWKYIEVLSDYFCKLLAERNDDLTWARRKIGLSEGESFTTEAIKSCFDNRNSDYFVKELFNIFEATLSEMYRSEPEDTKISVPYKVAKVIVMMARFFLQVEGKLPPIPFGVVAKKELLASVAGYKDIDQICTEKYKYKVFKPGGFGSTKDFHMLQDHLVTIVSLEGATDNATFSFNFSRMVDFMRVLEILEQKGALDQETHDFDHGYFIRTRGSGMDLMLRQKNSFAFEIRLEKSRAKDLLGVFRAIKKCMGPSYDYMLQQKGDI